MADNAPETTIWLPACRELLEIHPESDRLRELVEALEDATPDKPGQVVSFCKSIIETTCKTILTDRGVSLENWKLGKLVTRTCEELRLGFRADGSEDAALSRSTGKVVDGLNKIVQGIAEIRNTHGSVAHGSDAYAPLLDSRYAEILARATDAVVGLLFKTHIGTAAHDPLARFRYGDHPDFDEFIDNDHGPFRVLEISLLASEALYNTDFEGYRAELVEFRQNSAKPDGSGEEQGSGESQSLEETEE